MTNARAMKDVRTVDPQTGKSLKHLEAAEEEVASLDRAFDGAGLKALRTIVAGYPDMGAPGAGEVVASLFMLLEHLIADGRFDRDALLVHVRAWRLMATTTPDAEATAVLLYGLKSIRTLHNQARAA